jgi:Flagellar regulatory protein FleQ
MVHFGTAMIIDTTRDITRVGDQQVPVAHSILMIRDSDKDNEYLDTVCEFLDIGVEHVPTGQDLRAILSCVRPMAIIADLDSEIADGFHVMKMAAGFDPTLPVLLLTDNDPALLGAVDAVREIWGLTRVTTTTGYVLGELVDFICQAARDAGRPRLMRV